MRCKIQRERITLVAVVLLTVYGSVGVLGYGLHTLFHCEHHSCDYHPHCDRGIVLAEAKHHHAHDFEHAGDASESPTRDADPLSSHSADDCSICDFLAQAQSHFDFEIDVTMVEVLSPIPPALHVFYCAPELGLPPSRGPPVC